MNRGERRAEARKKKQTEQMVSRQATFARAHEGLPPTVVKALAKQFAKQEREAKNRPYRPFRGGDEGER